MSNKQIVCECGFKNPEGTQLCLNCGRLINDDYDKKKTTDVMRYDGQAIRSKTKNKTLLDRIWNFFASIKTGVTLLIITVIAASIGTIFPQQYFIPMNVNPEQYYFEHYGSLGLLYYKLGFHNLYSSWWFLILLGLVAFSIITSSIDRGVPLHKSLRNQRTKKHDSFFKRQRLFMSSEDKVDLDALGKSFKAKRYKVKREGDNLLLEKGRLSRYGPYINHTGLIILLIGAMLRFIPGFYLDEMVYVKEGETKPVPGTDREYYIKNNDFIFEEYDEKSQSNTNPESIDPSMNKIAKNYETKATLYKNSQQDVIGSSANLKEVAHKSIKVNKPLTYENLQFYQSSFDNSLLKDMTFNLKTKDGDKVGNPFTVNLENPKKKYNVGNGYTINLRSYAPDYEKIENGVLATKSPNPNNPAFVFEVTKKGEKPEFSFLRIKDSQDISKNNKMEVKFANATNQWATVLAVKKDLTLPILFTGFIIFLLGLAVGSYINHRRIWINTNDGKFNIAGHTNKNYYGFSKEINQILDKHNIQHIVDTKKDIHESKEANNG
ncbi:cytochrome c biogenesis protein ResB [Mammaliicoccus stepanovicii]|uniref:Cytochrome c biogenesis protein CcsB n=1 Tax=Mammaliicoccus stepanovicii TaxID=643214 RepID=A0A239Z916_9STAP|nr:cytochrome c biogenesis protein ResB [Mammaliicoccus stepanovicii]PNZ72690.1 cytochrome c biogenesis protein ResB [Mammaliicoccus stepanovicii]GGI39896.1 cytochrome c biogenesis protein [Mammaliicoccus stepanovicii]SNV67186.1 Cytochrome c biogenesis protein CcsB [Mammaliicoccus stepanovicii]